MVARSHCGIGSFRIGKRGEGAAKAADRSASIIAARKVSAAQWPGGEAAPSEPVGLVDARIVVPVAARPAVINSPPLSIRARRRGLTGYSLRHSLERSAAKVD